MAERIRVLISEEELAVRIREIADQVRKDYEGETLQLVCILKGSVFFACDLAKMLDMDVRLDFMTVSSYGGGTESSGAVKIKKDLDHHIEGKHVLIVEDIIDSGNTLSALVPMLRLRNPASIEVATILDKPSRRVKHDVQVKYTGFEIPDEFVVGYGLDYDQKYRNLPYIGVVEFVEE